MPTREAESGICIVRVEVQSDHLLITITTERNIGRHLHAARSSPKHHFSDPNAVLKAVADFLGSFTPQSGRGGGCA
jgi:hypothetical protein